MLCFIYFSLSAKKIPHPLSGITSGRVKETQKTAAPENTQAERDGGH
jgi:hypothetical protein